MRLRRDKIVVALEHKVLMYNFADLRLEHSTETLANPHGLAALSPAPEHNVLACPGLHCGQVPSRPVQRRCNWHAVGRAAASCVLAPARVSRHSKRRSARHHVRVRALGTKAVRRDAAVSAHGPLSGLCSCTVCPPAHHAWSAGEHEDTVHKRRIAAPARLCACGPHAAEAPPDTGVPVPKANLIPNSITPNWGAAPDRCAWSCMTCGARASSRRTRPRWPR